MSQKAGIFIIHDNQILVGHPTRHPQDFLSIPKGKIDKGEDSVGAMLRELEEETSYLLEDFDTDMAPEYVGRFVYRNKKHALHVFYIIINSKPEKEAVCTSIVDNDPTFLEVDWYTWISFEDVPKYCHEAQISAFKALLNKIK